jgi:hypothetical protein
VEYEKLKNGFLDMLQSQAADRFYELWIGSQMTGQGFDPSKEKVDGGPINFGVPDKIFEAGSTLAKASCIIGRKNYKVVELFTCMGYTAKQVAHEFEESGDRAEKRWRHYYRGALTELAEYWIKTPHRRRVITSTSIARMPWTITDTGS